jgi:flagellum-specific ATP synthase
MMDKRAMNALERLGAVTATARAPLVDLSGMVSEASPGERFVRGLSAHAALGDQLRIDHADGAALAEVIRIDGDRLVARLYERRSAAFVGARASLRGEFRLCPDPSWRGRVVDALGRPIDGGGPLAFGPPRPVDADPPPSLSRAPITQAVRTGVKVIDLFAPLVEGQRIGVFAGSGVGKSTLLGMIAAASRFDVVVAGLVGERGREVNDILEGPLRAHRARTVTVVATGDETAMMRRLAPMTATTIAEAFRDEGRRVLLIVDSLTRAAHAGRDVALSAGEPPVSRGYPPSVFADLARLTERAGRGAGDGSITAVYAVLVDGDDHDDPVADSARGTLDGHIVLSRTLAEAGRFPAVDPLASLSRLAARAFSGEEWELSRRLRGLIARYEDTADLRLLGGHVAGRDGELDRAVALVPLIYEALVQTPSDSPSADAFAELAALLAARKPAADPAGPSA